MEVVIKYPGDDALKGVPTPTEVISESESVKSGKATCEVITGPECMVFSMIDIMYNISLQDESVYYMLSLVSREFAYEYVLPLNATFKAHFGYHIEQYANCTRYTKYGKLHRREGPAELFRDPNWGPPLLETLINLPMFENRHGMIYGWYLNGLPHREKGIALYFESGYKKRYEYGLLHSNDFPAIEEPDGTEFWYQHNVLHRDNGPAAIFSDGAMMYFINGVEEDDENPYCEEDFAWV